MRSYAVHVATGSKDKQEKRLTRPVLVPHELYDRFRELVRPLRCFKSTIFMQDDECRGVGVFGTSGTPGGCGKSVGSSPSLQCSTIFPPETSNMSMALSSTPCR